MDHVYGTGLVVEAFPSYVIHTVHFCRVHRIMDAIIVEPVVELGLQRGAVLGDVPFSMRRCVESFGHELAQMLSLNVVQDQGGIETNTTAGVRVDVLHHF